MSSATAPQPEVTFEQHKLIDWTLSNMISGSGSFETQSPQERQQLVNLRGRLAEQLARRQNTGTQRLEGVTPEEYGIIHTELTRLSSQTTGPFSQSQVMALLNHINEAGVIGQKTQQAQQHGKAGW